MEPVIKAVIVDELLADIKHSLALAYEQIKQPQKAVAYLKAYRRVSITCRTPFFPETVAMAFNPPVRSAFKTVSICFFVYSKKTYRLKNFVQIDADVYNDGYDCWAYVRGVTMLF